MGPALALAALRRADVEITSPTVILDATPATAPGSGEEASISTATASTAAVSSPAETPLSTVHMAVLSPQGTSAARLLLGHLTPPCQSPTSSADESAQAEVVAEAEAAPWPDGGRSEPKVELFIDAVD
jgi:hypothetical protein